MCPFLNKSRKFYQTLFYNAQQNPVQNKLFVDVCTQWNLTDFDHWIVRRFETESLIKKKMKVWLTQRSTLLLYSMMDYPGLYSLLFQVQHWKELHSVLKIRIRLSAPPRWSFSCRWRHQYDLGSQPAVIIVYGCFFPTLALVARKLCTQ